MKVFAYPLWIIYRIWFYILVLIPILILFPFLIVSISNEKWYPFFFKLARIWSKFILIGMGFGWKINGKLDLEKGKSYMFIANHVSMIDVMLMLVCIKNNPFVFVGKKELTKIPLFGFFYKHTCIIVDRSDSNSRKQVYLSAKKKLDSGLSVCIFPEGLVPEEDVVLANFKDGAFRLAINHQIPIIPLSFLDNKKRFSYTFFSGRPGLLRVLPHIKIETKGLKPLDAQSIKKEAFDVIYNSLIKEESK
jgi:1-acyl-sn-glycerol-3-phosphate acyltransferase